MTAVTPQTPLERVLGGATATRLQRELEIGTAQQLLDHFPRRWVDYGALSSFAELTEGEHVSFVARVVSQHERTMQRRRGFIVEVTVVDEDAETLRMAFFSSHAARRDLTSDVTAVFHGKVGNYQGQPTLNNPEFEVIATGETVTPGTGGPAAAIGRPVPLYPATGGLSSPMIRQSVQILLEAADLRAWSDPVPEDILRARNLPTLAQAYELVHRPQESGSQHRGIDRFRFQEALLLQGLLARRRVATAQVPARAYPRRGTGPLAEFDAQLPFELTAGQRRCGELISRDVDAVTGMNRLLQGEVGSGKTVVALRAMLQVVDSGGQAALVAPTEVLAVQHARSVQRMLGGLAGSTLSGLFAAAEPQAVRVTLLTGSMSAAQRKQALLDIASGQAGIVIGTHAVLGEQVQFAELGLVVVDEQHRFGVQQRSALRTRYTPAPHMLVMSATPIPRSVAMTVFGDLELTVLTGLPSGRKPVQTHLAPMVRGPQYIQRVWERVATTVHDGGQVYIVCPKISHQDKADTAPLNLDERFGGSADPQYMKQFAAQDASVELIAAKLAENPQTAQLRRGTLHGRMSSEERDQVMTGFENAELDVLISTTVIEVGVDVPRATLMVILDADAFGVSTLHQLRGRVGRGTQQSMCLLVTRVPEDHPSMQRLHEVAATNDGMELARLDLRRRREGDVLGVGQAGKNRSLRLLEVSRHEEVIAQAAEDLRRLSHTDREWAQWPDFQEAVQQWAQQHDGAEDYVQQG